MTQARAFAFLAALALLLARLQQCEGDISLGAKLKVGEAWISSGSTFAIGFTNSDLGMFNLAIWYDSVKIVPKTVVWTAMTNGNQLKVSQSAELVLQRDGLVVMDGSRNVWQTTGICDGCVVARADMLESGNFVLLSNRTVWQSFSSPTDTLLPSQQLDRSLSSGKYSLIMSNSQLALQYQEYLTQIYWSIQSNNPDSSSKNPPHLNLSSTGVLTFYDASGSKSQRYALDYGSDLIRRLTLERSGNLRLYSLASGNDSWNVVWQAMLLECDIFGACGPFGLCSYRPTRTCSCPPGFHRVDQNDDSSGCTYNVPFQCDAKFIQLDRADYKYNDYKYDPQATSMDDCKKNCLNDCKCLAAAYKYDGSGQCFLKGSEDKIYNGLQSNGQSNFVFLKVSSLDTEAQEKLSIGNPFVTDVNATNVARDFTIDEPSHFPRYLHPLILSIAIIEFVLYSAAGSVSWLLWRKNIRRMWQEYTMDIEGAPARFSYEQLQLATNNFSERLGSGGFGTVYKGVLPDETLVAVKQLEVATQAEKQFKAEVTTIGRIHHINLVRLLGYCTEGSHRLLVYEYMPNGSLEKVLFSGGSNDFFCDWNTRFTIAIGIARGITYLHEECHECILHCDIKPQNILLDEDFCPKVSDFGLAKLMKREDAYNVTTIRGTRGYLAPEWISKLEITSKADVYSFGMVLLEIISGRDNFRFTPSAMSSNRWYFPRWAFEKYIAADLESIVDPKLGGGNVDREQLQRVLKVAFWCIQVDADSRPAMSKVVQMLEDNIGVPEPPFLGAFEEEADISLLLVDSNERRELSSSDVLLNGR